MLFATISMLYVPYRINQEQRGYSHRGAIRAWMSPNVGIDVTQPI
jgi:hypothetical protein